MFKLASFQPGLRTARFTVVVVQGGKVLRTNLGPPPPIQHLPRRQQMRVDRDILQIKLGRPLARDARRNHRVRRHECLWRPVGHGQLIRRVEIRRRHSVRCQLQRITLCRGRCVERLLRCRSGGNRHCLLRLIRKLERDLDLRSRGPAGAIDRAR